MTPPPPLPPRESIAPADRMRWQLLTWGHSHLVLCPTCHEPALVGYDEGTPVAFSCHRCGPFSARR